MQRHPALKNLNPLSALPSSASLNSRSAADETDLESGGGGTGIPNPHPHAGLDRNEVLEGLRRVGRQGPRTLSAKYFYDAEGSRLFEAICALPEYYPTRTELGILQTHAREIARRAGPGMGVVEYGSGSSRKTRILLDALQGADANPAYYMPVDISETALREAADSLRLEYPALPIHPVCADYMTWNALPAAPEFRQGKRLLFFPGSTIGNLHPHEARALLRAMRRIAQGGSGTESIRPAPGSAGALLIGVDLRKDKTVLESGYNDAQGVTAAFNLNILRRLNRELHADFPLDEFQHRAFFDDAKSRIEMHLVARRRLTVRIGGEDFDFEAGESIHTENSYKYSVEDFEALLASAGFVPTACWTDARKWFGVFYAEAR